MTSQLVFLLLLATISLSFGSPLNSTENAELQKTCGRDARYHTKVVNGEGPRDYPWAVSANVEGILTATVISPRHIMLFNMIEMNKTTAKLSVFNDIPINETAECQVNDLILPKELNDLFQVKFVVDQFGGRGTNQVKRIVVIDGCIQIDTYKPLIIELENNLKFDKTHGAVCLPKKDQSVDSYSREDKEFTFYGLGSTGSVLTSAQFLKKSCNDNHEGNFVFCGKSVNVSRGLCAGDFGGGAITTVDDRNILLGIYAEGNYRCETALESRKEPEFIDISAYTEQICRQTGICVNQEIEYTTTTAGVYIQGSGDTEATEQSQEPVSTVSTAKRYGTDETIVAETFPKMKLNCSAAESSSDKVPSKEKEIHIHIHLDKDSKVVAN